MNKKGITTIEVLMWMMGGVFAILGYVHMTFATYREVLPRLESIERKVDTIISKGTS